MSATQTPALLKPLRGWVTTFHVTQNGQRRGPYHVRRWKERGRLHKQYIKPADVERVKAACQIHREKQQARRQGARRVNNYISNADFLYKMLMRWETGKIVTKAMEAYIWRLCKTEDMYVDDRPPLRRRIIRSIATHNGQTVIVKTVLELDGTSKTFMVPLEINYIKNSASDFFDRLKRELLEAFDRIHGAPTQLDH
jgi:hypothetical protein